VHYDIGDEEIEERSGMAGLARCGAAGEDSAAADLMTYGDTSGTELRT
jgi:hypothetical protein